MEVKASKTLRKFRFCGADRWSEQEAAVAAELLRRLEVARKLQERAAGYEERTEKWIWVGYADAPYKELMRKAVEAVVSGGRGGGMW